MSKEHVFLRLFDMLVDRFWFIVTAISAIPMSSMILGFFPEAYSHSNDFCFSRMFMSGLVATMYCVAAILYFAFVVAAYNRAVTESYNRKKREREQHGDY